MDFLTSLAHNARMAKVIIDNRVGEPDLSFIPPHLLAGRLSPELRKLTEYGYGLDRRGIPVVLEALAADFNKRHNSNITQANIVLTNGGARGAGSSAILRVLGKIRRTGYKNDPKVLFIQPGYNLYETQFAGFNVYPEFKYANFRNAGTDAEKLAILHAQMDEDVFFLPLCSPNNPTGEVYSEAFLRGILDLMREFPNLHIINDSIYDRILRNPAAKIPNLFVMADDELKHRIYEVNALSKSYAYPGIRAGWLIGSENEIDALQPYKDAQFGPLGNVAQLIVLGAVRDTPLLHPRYFDEVNEVYNRRLKLVHEKLHQIEGFKGEVPQGGIYYWADFSKIKGVTASDLVKELESRGIYVSPGAKFGDENAIRINCGAIAQQLKIITDNIVSICQQKGVVVNEKTIYADMLEDDLPEFAKNNGLVR